MKTFLPVNTKAFILTKHYNILCVLESVLPALAAGGFTGAFRVSKVKLVIL